MVIRTILTRVIGVCVIFAILAMLRSLAKKHEGDEKAKVYNGVLKFLEWLPWIFVAVAAVFLVVTFIVAMIG